MIAPEANGGKGLRAGLAVGLRVTAIDHGFVNEIILLPNFGQRVAKLRGKLAAVVTS